MTLAWAALASWFVARRCRRRSSPTRHGASVAECHRRRAGGGDRRPTVARSSGASRSALLRTNRQSVGMRRERRASRRGRARRRTSPDPRPRSPHRSAAAACRPVARCSPRTESTSGRSRMPRRAAPDVVRRGAIDLEPLEQRPELPLQARRGDPRERPVGRGTDGPHRGSSLDPASALSTDDLPTPVPPASAMT